MIVGVDQLSPTDGMLADLTVEAMLDPRMEVLQAGEATFDEKQMAMSAIVEEFYPGVRHLAQSITCSPEIADEVTWDAFAKVWFKAEAYEPRPSATLKSWVMKITYNAAVNELRKTKIRQSDSIEAMDDWDRREFSSTRMSSGLETSVEQQVEDREGIRELEAMLEQITPEEYQPVLRLVADGYKYTEIAKILGIEEGTVK